VVHRRARNVTGALIATASVTVTMLAASAAPAAANHRPTSRASGRVAPAPGRVPPSASPASPAPGTESGTAPVPVPLPDTRFTCAPSIVSQARQSLVGSITARIGQLQLLVGRVRGAVHLEPAHAQSLLDTLTVTELPGLGALLGQVQAAGTCRALRAARHSMFADFRVYEVVAPQTELVIAGDELDHRGAVLDQRGSQVASRIQTAVATGRDGTSASAWLADYQRNLAAAQALVAGRSAALVTQTPQSYPADEPVLAQARTDLHAAGADLRTAATDLDRAARSVRG